MRWRSHLSEYGSPQRSRQPSSALLQPIAVGHLRQHLHAPAPVGDRAQAHEVQLASVAHPRRAMQRSVGALAPPQADIQLA